jgi:iron(III) transport system permease protein
MEQTLNNRMPSPAFRRFRKITNFFKKPQNVILLVLGILLSIFTIVPIVAIVRDAFIIHTGTIESDSTGRVDGYTLWNFIDLFTGSLAKKNLWIPLGNTLAMSVIACFTALLFGGLVAYLITRTNLKYKKYISSIFIFPYIMPQWTLAMVWRNLFNSASVTGGADGLLAALFNIRLPLWWCSGLFPSAIVLGLHYAPFAYILIGGIFKNMDANLEEAATILNTPRWKIFTRVTLPMVKPAILSTILLVFSSAMGSYPVPHYLNFTTMATRYVEINGSRPGASSIIAIIMMLIGVGILLVNQASTSGRKQYTTVTGKSGQASKINLGKIGKYALGIILIVATFFTSIYPIISFTMETFLPNPGDYSGFTLKWWITSNAGGENGLYGNLGILYNKEIWNSFLGTLRVAFVASILAGTIGFLVGYAVSKSRKSKWAGYVNGIAFLPYLLPSLAVGAAYFVIGLEFSIWGTYLLFILVGTIKYIPFSSRSSLNAMMQISGEIEEAGIIQNIPWWKRMLKIVVPIQKTSIISGYLLPFITAMRELTLFMMLGPMGMIVTTMLDYYDEMGLYAFSSGINLILIITILLCNWLINKLTGASLDKSIGG